MKRPVPPPSRHRPAGRVWAAALLISASLGAQAQYKVVDAEGRVTYTDRPTGVAAGSRVSPVRAGAVGVGSAEDQAALPPALRSLATRFPVTLITSSDCDPCNRARQLLRQRGVPYTERSVSSDADTDALQRQTAGRTVPALLVGQQVLRGLLDTDWHQTLDLAGYPKESGLPRGWQGPAVQALSGQAAALAAGRSSGSDSAARTSVRSTGNPANSVPNLPPARQADPAPPGIRF